MPILGYHNVEAFEVTTPVRGQKVIFIQDWWKSGLEPSFLLQIP